MHPDEIEMHHNIEEPKKDWAKEAIAYINDMSVEEFEQFVLENREKKNVSE